MKRNHAKKGFTLAELLVVVAIIGVLVAIAIPTFTTQLKKSQIATDDANFRAAIAAGAAAELIADDSTASDDSVPTNGEYLQPDGTWGVTGTAYTAKATATTSDSKIPNGDHNKGDKIKCSGSSYTIEWVTGE